MHALRTSGDLSNRAVTEYSFKELIKFADKDKWTNRFMRAYEGRSIPNIHVFGSYSRFIVIVRDGQELGYVRITNFTELFEEVYKDEVWRISEIFVKPEFRHQGVMRRMIEYLIEFQNVKAIYLDVKRYRKNLDYYQDLGFRGGIVEQNSNLIWLFLNDFKDVLDELCKLKKYIRFEERELAHH